MAVIHCHIVKLKSNIRLQLCRQSVDFLADVGDKVEVDFVASVYARLTYTMMHRQRNLHRLHINNLHRKN